jgi:hypothetical protein
MHRSTMASAMVGSPMIFVPAVYRQLAGDGDSATVVAVFDDFEQIPALLPGQGLRPPIVEDEKLDALKLARTRKETWVIAQKPHSG